MGSKKEQGRHKKRRILQLLFGLPIKVLLRPTPLPPNKDGEEEQEPAETSSAIRRLMRLLAAGMGQTVRVAKGQDAPSKPLPWPTVRERWGLVDAAATRRFIRGRKIQRMAMMIAAVYSLVLAAQGGAALAAGRWGWGTAAELAIGAMVAWYGISVAVISTWQIDVVHAQRWMSFGGWLRGRYQ